MANDSPQQLKKVAALAYDYHSDPRWAEYWSNVLIPNHLSSHPDVERHFQFKFYQRYIDPDLHVEPLSSLSSTRPSTRPSASRSSTQRQPAQSDERANGTRNATGTATYRSAGNSALRMDRHSIQFLENAWVVVMAFLAILPFAPKALSDKTYRSTFFGAMVASGHSLYLQYGKPRAWNLQSIQVWLQSAVAGKDFMYILYSLVFISTFMPIKFALIPVVCQSLGYVAQYLRRNYSNAYLYRNYLEKPCRWLEANSGTLRVLSSNCEIALGFLLVFLLLTPQRNLIQLLVYWQLLKLMYHAPTTASSHRSSWSMIGMKVNPLIHQYLPFLESPLGFAQRWFHN